MQGKVLDYEIKIDNVEYKNSLQEDLRINSADLDSDFIDQSAKFAYYGTLCEMARYRENQLKHQLQLLEAKLDVEIRASAKDIQAGDPKFKMTEKMIEHMCKGDVRYQKLLDEHLAAVYTAGVLYVAREAMASRRECLVSLGANKRFLDKGEPRVMNAQAEHIRKNR